MVQYIKNYGVFVKILNKQIIAYDTEKETKKIDYSSIGILHSVDAEFADAICKSLEIDSIEEYGVEIQQESDYE